MIRTVIIDDEKNNIDNAIGLIIKSQLQIEVVGIATSAEDAIDTIIKTNPDLLLLDIQMPGKNGFDVLRALPHYEFEVIFITAYDQYGIQAVKFSAIDYLLKPINSDELKYAVEKVADKLTKKKKNLQLENLLELIKNKDSRKDHKIALSSSKEIRFAATESIIRCESSNAYTKFFFADEKSMLVSKPIFEYEELLKDYGFIRCHQSHLVNKEYIKSLVKEDGGYLLLADKTKIPISRNKKESVLKALITLNK